MAAFGDDYYVCRFQNPGEIEAQMTEAGVPAYDCKNIYTTRKPGPPIFPKGEYEPGFNYPGMPKTLPSWLSQEDLDYYLSKFKETKDLTGGLNYCRNLNFNWELIKPWTGVVIDNVPVKFIIGDQGLVYTTGETKEYINHGFKKYVPSLKETIILEDVAHFSNQEASKLVTDHIYEFIKQY